MSFKVNRWIGFVFILMIASSCSSGATTGEKEQINTMDSTSKALKENKEKVEEQTEKVEASLEKLESEFETANNEN